MIGPGYSAGYVIEASGTEPVSLTLGDTRDDTTAHREVLAFSPDGGRIAALTSGPHDDGGPSHSYAVATYDANTAERVAQVQLGSYQSALGDRLERARARCADDLGYRSVGRRHRRDG